MFEFNQSRITSLKSHIPDSELGKKLVVGILSSQTTKEKIIKTGLSFPLTPGEVILPKVIGPISKFNSFGKEVILRDQPKESCSREMEFTRKEWRGKNDSEEVTSFVWIHYERYPRKLVNPYGIEFHVTQTDEDILITTNSIPYETSSEQLKHTINLFLEFFGRCMVYEEGKKPVIITKEIRLNWKLLPAGRYPWNRIETSIKESLVKQPPKSLAAALNRFQKINSLNPDFRAAGSGGYSGYVVFGFDKEKKFVFECQFPDNAIYVFDDDWEALSMLTKAEIIQGKKHIARIIHVENWFTELKKKLGK